MRKKLVALVLSILALSTLILTAFAVEPLSDEEVIAQKRAWYPFIRTCEEKLYETANSKALRDIEIDRILVYSTKCLPTQAEIQSKIDNPPIIPNMIIYIHFTATGPKGLAGYIFAHYPQNDTVYLYSDSSSNLTASNYNDYNSFLNGNFNPDYCTFLGNEYVYNSALSGYYYIGFDLADYQNYVATSTASTPVETSEPTTSTPAEAVEPAQAPVEAPEPEPTPAPVEQYTKGQELIISGKTDFNYFYTYKDGLNYKCFSLTKDGQRFYASVREDLYDYYRNAFQNHSLTLKGTYKFTAEDGSPVVSVSTLVEGTKETNLRSYLWTVNKGSTKNPNLKAFADLKGDGLVLSASKDGQSITIDSNPWGAAQGSQAYKLDNDLALLLIKELNSELGLPDWLYTEMMGTRALDGRQKEVFDYVTVTWSYHPDSGINILYRKNN